MSEDICIGRVPEMPENDPSRSAALDDYAADRARMDWLEKRLERYRPNFRCTPGELMYLLVSRDLPQLKVDPPQSFRAFIDELMRREKV